MARPNLSTVLSTTALVVAVFGATPVGQAARDATPAFARNADKVDGIHAAKTPKAGHLLALGKNKKFPASAVPPGPAGPKGDQGDKGDKGDAGPGGASWHERTPVRQRTERLRPHGREVRHRAVPGG